MTATSPFEDVHKAAGQRDEGTTPNSAPNSGIPLGRLKNIIGGVLVCLYVVSVFLCYYWLDDRLSDQEFRITLLILSPVTVVYVVAYFKEVARTMFSNGQDSGDRRHVTARFAVLSIGVVSLFCVAVIYTLYEFMLGSSLTSEDLKNRLALIETIFGGFLGLLAEPLFNAVRPAGT